MRRELTSPTPLFSSREPVSHEGTFSPFRRGAVHPRGRVTLRAHSASPRRPSTDLTQELRGRNASGIGVVPVFVPALNQPPTTFSLFLPSLLSSATTATRASLLPRLPAIVLRCSFSSRFEPTSSPNHANVLSLRFQRHLSYNYNPCPLHSAGSSHTTYVPRASELVATAGRSLDYVPSLFHHHPTATLAHTLSFSRPSWPSPYPSTRPLRHFHHHRLGSPTLCPLSLVLVAPTISPSSSPITSTPFYISLSPCYLPI